MDLLQLLAKQIGYRQTKKVIFGIGGSPECIKSTGWCTAHLGLEGLLQFSHLHLGVTRRRLGSLIWG